MISISQNTVQQINSALSRVVERLNSMEGKSGAKTINDAIRIVSEDTLLARIGNLTINTYGTDHVAIALSIGSHYDAVDGWIADASNALILEGNPDGNWAFYRDSGLTVGAPYSPTASGPHTGSYHTASEIILVPTTTIASTDVQAGFTEVGNEKLARDGSQTMLGNLDMDHHDVGNVNDIEVEGNANVAGNVNVGLDVNMTGTGGIIDPTHIDWTQSTPEALTGRMAWDSVEKTIVVFVSSGS
jgi:hypothetical protein